MAMIFPDSHGNGLHAGRFLSCLLPALLGLAAVLPASTFAGDGAPAFDRHAVDAMFDQAMARYELPGLAVGVVEDGEIVYMRTAGELRAGEGEPVDADTLFKIASNSKAMTTALLARLVDQGKLAWDDPVVRHLPDFRMHDPWVTREIQVRDLVIHNTGLGPGGGDLMLWPEPNRFTREQVVAGIAHLPPASSFRSRYVYNNVMYIVAGEVAAAAAGAASFEELLRSELFEPLGLERCRVGEWRLDEVGNVAQPHMRIDGRMQVVREDAETVPAVPMAAAGGVRCGLNDMLAWVRMWLQPETHGLVDGQPWLSPAQREVLWSAQMPMTLGRRMREWEGANFSAYGYGWRLNDSGGTRKVAHTGTLAGMFSAVTLLPEKGAGFVVMMNGPGSDARTVLVQALTAHFTGPGGAYDVDHYAGLLDRERDEAAPEPSAPGVDTQARRPADPAALSGWLGIYRDPWFGDVSICVDPDRRVRFESERSPMLTGTVMQVDERLLVDWHDASITSEPWLDFSAPESGGEATLAMTRVDPSRGSSSNFQDLAFVRSGSCP